MSPVQDSDPDPVPAPQNQIQQDVGSNPGQTLGQQFGWAINISGGNVSFQDGQGNSLPPEALNQAPEIPTLLPYLPNRTEQEFELRQAIQRLMAQAQRQPLVCLVHGDEQQSHDQFLVRLQKVSLPRLLRVNLKQTAIKVYHLKWPASLEKKNIDSLSARLLKNLADVVENDSFATLEQINQTFSKHPGPVLVHLHLLTDDWKRLGSNLLSKLLDFWDSWPTLAPHQTLVVCIFIKYRLSRATDTRQRGWFFNPFAWLRRLLKYRQCQKLNQAIIHELESLPESGFSQFKGFTGVVLPKLDNINRNHVEDWVHLEDTKEFAGDAVVAQLLRAVGSMFELDETMSMDQAAMQLKSLLEEILVRGSKL